MHTRLYADTQISRQLGFKCLAQGHFDMWQEEAWLTLETQATLKLNAAAGNTGEYVRVVSAVRSLCSGELDTLLLWLDDIWASSREGEGEGVSCTRS